MKGRFASILWCHLLSFERLIIIDFAWTLTFFIWIRVVLGSDIRTQFGLIIKCVRLFSRRHQVQVSSRSVLDRVFTGVYGPKIIRLAACTLACHAIGVIPQKLSSRILTSFIFEAFQTTYIRVLICWLAKLIYCFINFAHSEILLLTKAVVFFYYLKKIIIGDVLYLVLQYMLEWA